MLAGVVAVYGDQDAVDRGQPLDTLQYPRLDEFLADQAVLTRLISHGPLYDTHIHQSVSELSMGWVDPWVGLG